MATNLSSSERIAVQCSCAKGLATLPQDAGKRLQCPTCGQAVEVPAVSLPTVAPITSRAQDEAEGLTKTTLIVMWSVVGVFAVGCILFLLWHSVSSSGTNIIAASETPKADAVAPEPIDPWAGVATEIAGAENESTKPLNPAIQAVVESNVAAEKSAPITLLAEDLYDRVVPSVVTIEVKDEMGEHIVTGSGFFIDADLLQESYEGLETDKRIAKARKDSKNGSPNQVGYILTNYHVIRPAVSADIVLLSGDRGTAEDVIAEDKEADLALLSVLVPANGSVTGMPLALDDPRVGATVYAIGSPEGLSSSLSQGIVSGFRELNEGSRWLQTTTPISHGSSGGPLVLADGTIAGVTTLTRKDAQNLNFAVPVSKVWKFLSSEFRSRDIAEGASIYWHEMHAFVEMSVALKNSQSHDESQAAVLLKKAWQEMRDGHYDQAIASAQEVDKSLPDEFNYLAAYVIGNSHSRVALKAAGASSQLARGTAGASKASRDLYATYRVNDHAIAAQGSLVRTTKLNPNFSPGLASLVRHYSWSANWPDALIESNALVKLMPRCGEALWLRAGCYSELDRPSSARSDLQAAIELAPRTGFLHYELARVLVDLGNYTEAIASYETALDLKFVPAFLVHQNLGYAYRKAGEFDKAIAEYEQAARALGGPGELYDREIAKCRRHER